MTTAKKQLDAEIERDLAELKHVADEIRLKIHLAGLDMKSAWQTLDKKLELLEERAGYEGDHVVQATRELASELKKSLSDFKQRVV